MVCLVLAMGINDVILQITHLINQIFQIKITRYLSAR